MTYNNYSQIQSLKDVEEFFRHIVHERGVNFHPDDMFEDYTFYDNDVKAFYLEECSIYNNLMEQSFEICEKEGVDIYKMALKELYVALEYDN